MTAPAAVVSDDWLADRATFEVRCRDGHLASPAGVGVSLLGCRYWMRLPPGDESLAPHLLRDGYWESWVSLAFARAVRPGACVVDAGAHVGWFTMLALARGAARVFAVEPQPEIAALLRDSLIDNRVHGVVDLWSGAIGAGWETADLLLYGALTGSASFRKAPGYTPSRTVRVGVAPLDALLDRPDWRRVDLVKVDIEGWEVEAWAGMQGTLARNPRAAVVMEVASHRGYSLREFVDQFRRDGWRVRAVDEDGNLVPEGEVGIVLLPLVDSPQSWATLWIDRPEAPGKEAAA